MNRIIERGSRNAGFGSDGQQIFACHFANIGLEVLLLDIVPKDAPEGNIKGQEQDCERCPGFCTLNRNPSPIYSKSFAKKDQYTGNLDDDLSKIKDCDWVIEVVIERLDIKKQVFTNVEKYRKPGSLITSNTSGIPIHLMAEGKKR